MCLGLHALEFCGREPQQCPPAKQKANFIFHFIKKTVVSRSREVIFLLYSTLMRSHLKYSIHVQGPQHKKDMDPSEQAQRRPQEEHLSSEENSLCCTAQWGEGSYASSHPLSLLLTTAAWSVEEIIILQFRAVNTHFCMTHR